MRSRPSTSPATSRSPSSASACSRSRRRTRPRTCCTAIEAGYRHIDTAKAYGNEAEVGQAVRASGLDRAEFFITTKCWNADHGYDSATRALKTSLDRLEMEYVDLYLIHWPAPSQDRYVEAWKALIEAQQAGLARAIGVSNFQADHLRRIVDETGVTPAVNQIELHPYLQQRACGASTPTAASSPRPGARWRRARCSTTRWSWRSPRRTARRPPRSCCAGTSSSATSCSRSRSRPSGSQENIDIFDFELSADEMERIEALDRGERTGPDPDTFVRP